MIRERQRGFALQAPMEKFNEAIEQDSVLTSNQE